jgi:hypothetical protein
MVRMCELMTLACATALVAGSAASAADKSVSTSAGAKAEQVVAPSSARQAVNNVVNNVNLFGNAGCGTCTWLNGAFDGRDGQVSHLGGAVPSGQKAADDFYLCEGFVYDLSTISATLLTTTTQTPNNTFIKPKAEIWSDCNGCPDRLLYTLDKPAVTETGQTFGTAFDGRPLRVVNVTFDVTRETVIGNQNIVLKGGNYWLSIYGQTDGLCPTMQMCDVTYWGTTGNGIRGLPAKKINGLPTPTYNQFNFPSGCGSGAWHSVTDDCCIGCTDLNFSICASACKILIDNGGARRQVGAEAVGSTSQYAVGSFSAAETRTADDFVVPPCQDYRICYIEGCVLTNCPTFDGVFEIYGNDCNQPSYALHGSALVTGPIATKIIDLGYSAVMDGRSVRAYKLEFHDLNFTLTGGRQYWLSIGVRYTFSIQERAFFCYNADCNRSCLIRWNNAKVLTATTIQDNTVNTLGWASTGNDASFLIAADGLSSPGPIGATPACRADFNIDGVLNSQDIFDYLNAWFTGCP